MVVGEGSLTVVPFITLTHRPSRSFERVVTVSIIVGARSQTTTTVESGLFDYCGTVR